MLCYYLKKKKVLLLAIKFAIINNFLVIEIAVKMYQDSNNYVILKIYHMSLPKKKMFIATKKLLQ